jgi:hypothetical protein
MRVLRCGGTQPEVGELAGRPEPGLGSLDNQLRESMAAREPAASTADPAANQGEGGKETARTDGAKEAAGTRLTAMHIAGLAVLILGILVVLLIVMPEFNEDRDTATGVLGVVIPAFATIGAALFGITVGYNAGQSSGKETGKAEGKAEGEARKDEAAAVARTQGRKEVAEEVAALRAW